MKDFNRVYRNPDIQIVQEITQWDTPNHIYYIDRAEKLVGYRSDRSKKSKIFKKPLAFSRARRKFYVLKDYGFPSGSEYQTTSSTCTCKGFQFRKTCRHINELREQSNAKYQQRAVS